MKKALFATAAVAMAAAPVLAQDGPFKDVPNDHWAYQAIDKLAQLKIIIGDPDGLYKGKRTLTRYEMAVMLARLLDILDQRYMKAGANVGGTPPDLSGFATKEDLRNGLDGKQDKGDYATKGDLSGLATKAELAQYVKKPELDLIRRMVSEFQTELTTLGVDVDAVKKRLKTLEDRVSFLEDQWRKRLKITGAFSTNVRGNFRSGNAAPGVPVSGFRDKDGFIVTGGAGTSGSIQNDVRALHDLDLNLKATPNDNVTFESNVTMGNYLPYLGGGFGARSNRGAGVVNQDQATTLWSAMFTTGTKLPVVGSTGLTVGRMPTSYGTYTFETPDMDWYFNNMKTDMGTVPTDGAKVNFKTLGAGVTVQAGKINPVSYGPGSINLAPPVFVGASQGAYAGGLTRTNTTGVFGTGPRLGASMATQFAGANVNFNVSKLNVNATYLSFGNTPGVNAAGPANYDTVNVYGADASARILGLTLVGHYAKSDTRGTSATGRANKTTTNNEAYDASAQLGRGNFSIAGGYRNVDPLFGAPGNWARVGSFQNPTDIKGPYGKVSFTLTKRIELMASGQSYKGTGKISTAAGGLSTADKIENLAYGVRWAVTGPSSLEFSMENTDYTRADGGNKPREQFTNIGYRYDFNPATSLRFLYQVADFDGRANTNFNGSAAAVDNRQKGGVVTGQFMVKF